jgi:UDP-N-acetylmuramate dehydrogenase
VEKCCAEGLSGFEDLYDIPGTVGGALCMNAGAFNASIGDRVTEVMSLDRGGNKQVRKTPEILFDYRDSTFRRQKEIVMKAFFTLKRATPAVLLERMKEIKAQRDWKQPPDRERSCGSVFKRPAGGYAGALIEQAGLKGLRIGGARVSEKHANFIINDENGSAADIRALISRVQKEVLEKTGVHLEPEVVFLGEF